ncbi:MAG: lipoate--protein ligase [Muribaculaceae bacterium]|nr:lipoate--protein ligase [Muribaculaceae bacterium]
MKYLQLPYDEVRRLTFYLAMEEYAAQLLKDNKSIDELFFTWRVRPTVIFGRNQLIDSEVNVAYCKANGIEYYRRKSGGGCVYADMDNLMFSYITRSDDVTTTFAHYTHAIVAMLKDLGLDASDTSRNDIMIEGKKVSGNAFYHLPGISIVHGTMLYDTNMENMVKAITPSAAKLDSKGVKSVQSHITTLNRYLTMSIEEFQQHSRTTLCDGEIMLSDNDVAAIERIEEGYLTPEFILGNNPRCNKELSDRIEGVGEFKINLELNRNIIRDIKIAGDFFLLGDLDTIITRLKGRQFTETEIEKALSGLTLSRVIMNLTQEQFMRLIFVNRIRD